MKKLSLSLLLLAFVSLVASTAILSSNEVVADSYQDPFYNDFDNDGTKTLELQRFQGRTVIKREYYYNSSNIFPLTIDDYGFDSEYYGNRRKELLKGLYNKHGITPYSSNYENRLKEKYGEGSEEYLSAIKEYEEFLAFNEEYSVEYDKAYQLYKIDRDAYLAAHPEIVAGHTVNPSATKTTIKENDDLLYYIHIPYDYDPNKSYPILVMGHGEDFSLRTENYINEDGTTKPCSFLGEGPLLSLWYNQVKNPGEGREKYDCFIVSILNTNEFFRGDGGIGIVNQYNDYDLPDAYDLTSDDTGDTTYKASYSRVYDSSEISPGYQEQLICQLVDSLASTYSIDLSRQYMTGFSLGGILTMDIINHYPDRFAAAMPMCPASADISEENCRNLTTTNIWSISGNGDGTCNKYFSKLFVEEVNRCREKYQTGTNNVAQYSFFAGGHSNAYYNGKRTAASGVSITDPLQVLNFFFDSKREDIATTTSHLGTFEDPYSVKDVIDIMASHVKGEKNDIYLNGVVKSIKGDGSFVIADTMSSSDTFNVQKYQLETIAPSNMVKASNETPSTSLKPGYKVVINCNLDYSNNINSATIMNTSYNEANNFADSFISDFETICSISQNNLFNSVDQDLIDMWATYQNRFSLLDEDVKNLFISCNVDSSGNIYEQVMAKYEYIINKYPSLLSYINNQNVTKAKNSISVFDEQTSSGVLILIISCFVVFEATITLIYINKRKNIIKK